MFESEHDDESRCGVFGQLNIFIFNFSSSNNAATKHRGDDCGKHVRYSKSSTREAPASGRKCVVGLRLTIVDSFIALSLLSSHSHFHSHPIATLSRCEPPHTAPSTRFVLLQFSLSLVFLPSSLFVLFIALFMRSSRPPPRDASRSPP